MKNIDEFLAIINLCDDTELETLTTRCEQLLNERKTAARNALRHELMENLQKAIGDILNNGFNLTIQNEDNYYMWFLSPNQNFSIDLCE